MYEEDMHLDTQNHLPVDGGMGNRIGPAGTEPKTVDDRGDQEHLQSEKSPVPVNVAVSVAHDIPATKAGSSSAVTATLPGPSASRSHPDRASYLAYETDFQEDSQEDSQDGMATPNYSQNSSEEDLTMDYSEQLERARVARPAVLSRNHSLPEPDGVPTKPRHPVTERSRVPKVLSDNVKFFQADDGTGWFVCRHCRYQTTEEATLLTEHIPFHSKKGKHKCTSCSFSSNAADFVLSHMNEVHGSRKQQLLQEGKLRCRHCPFRTQFQLEFAEHTLYHVDMNRYHCSLCSFCAMDQLTVVDHEAIHFLQPLRNVDGIARVPRKYQRADDKTPFYLGGDLPQPKPAVKWPEMTDDQKTALRLQLTDILDTNLFF